MIRRPPRSTQSRSSAASDVYKRQVYDWNHFGGINGHSTFLRTCTQMVPSEQREVYVDTVGNLVFWCADMDRVRQHFGFCGQWPGIRRLEKCQANYWLDGRIKPFPRHRFRIHAFLERGQLPLDAYLDATFRDRI